MTTPLVHKIAPVDMTVKEKNAGVKEGHPNIDSTKDSLEFSEQCDRSAMEMEQPSVDSPAVGDNPTLIQGSSVGEYKSNVISPDCEDLPALVPDSIVSGTTLDSPALVQDLLVVGPT